MIDKKTLSILLIIFILSLIPKLMRVIKFTTLLAWDPYAHMAVSAYILDASNIPNTHPYIYHSWSYSYPPLMMIETALLSMFSNISLLPIYKYFGPFITSLAIFPFFIFVRKLINEKAALFSTLFFAAIPYILSRGILTLPENLAFFFFITAFYFAIGIDKLKYLILMSFFLVATWYSHISGLYLVSILGLYFIGAFTIGKTKHTKKLIIPIVIAFVLLAPFLIPNFSSVVLFYIQYGVGSSVLNFPSLDLLDYRFTNIISLFGFLGLIPFVYKYKFKKEGLLGLTLFSVFFFLISYGGSSPERFFPYFAIPLTILAGFFVYRIFIHIDRGYKSIFTIVVVILVITNLVPFHYTWDFIPWFTNGDYDAVIWLSNNTPSDSLVITQPIMELPVRAFAKRTTYREINLTTEIDDIKSNISVLHNITNKQIYILISTQKLRSGYVAKIKSARSLSLWGLNVTKFRKDKNFINIFENHDVVIFKANLENQTFS